MPFAATDRHVQCVDTRLGACHRTCCQLALGSPPTRRTALRGFRAASGAAYPTA